MKKLLLICLLGYLCVPISTLTAQVADSPGADFLHRSSPQLSPEQGDTHRGGVTRPDTLPQGIDLVSYSGQGQESESSSASEGEALIYGEIVNPDSLGPLKLTVTPYYLDPKSSFLRKELTIDPEQGEFFDGVMNPRVMKFLAELDLGTRTGYFNLSIGGRPILENYLISPGDSLKLSLDLRLMEVLFGGKNAAFYEAQYAIKREQKRFAFLSARQLVTPRDTEMLQKPENKMKMAKFKDHFGSRLLVLEPGKESLDYLLRGLEHPVLSIDAQMKVLDGYAGQLSSGQYNLLKAIIYCETYGAGFSTYRKFYHPMVEGKFEEEDRLIYRARLQKLVQAAEAAGFLSTTQLVSAPFLDMALEMAILTAIWEKRTFLDVIDQKYEGEVADRLRAGYLSLYLSALPDQETQILNYLEVTHASPWKDRILNLKRAHVTGDSVLPVTLQGLNDKTYTREDLLGRPVLLYFYFSSCSHSANYFKEYLFPLYQQTKELGYELIAISVDKDPELWKSRIGKYSDPKILNLNLRGEDLEQWVGYYEIHSYPKTMLLDEHGKIVSFNIRKPEAAYETFLDGFLHLYKNEIDTSKPTSAL